MTVLRWILGIVGGLFAAGAVLAFVIFIVYDIDLWLKRARAWRRIAWAIALFWFNTEVWGRVIITLVNWR
jgi:hypothetical protein